MKRIVARFEDEDDVEGAEDALHDADLEPDQPEFDNPLFDPTARLPEVRGFVWGGILGGVLGLVVISTTYLDLFVVPRLSPMMSADPLALLVLGLGVGVVVGGFIGGVVGTLRPIPEPEELEIAVDVPDARVNEATEILRSHDATAVDGSVTYHENPEEWRRGKSRHPEAHDK